MDIKQALKTIENHNKFYRAKIHTETKLIDLIQAIDVIVKHHKNGNRRSNKAVETAQRMAKG